MLGRMRVGPCLRVPGLFISGIHDSTGRGREREDDKSNPGFGDEGERGIFFQAIN